MWWFLLYFPSCSSTRNECVSYNVLTSSLFFVMISSLSAESLIYSNSSISSVPPSSLAISWFPCVSFSCSGWSFSACVVRSFDVISSIHSLGGSCGMIISGRLLAFKVSFKILPYVPGSTILQRWAWGIGVNVMAEVFSKFVFYFISYCWMCHLARNLFFFFNFFLRVFFYSRASHCQRYVLSITVDTFLGIVFALLLSVFLLAFRAQFVLFSLWTLIGEVSFYCVAFHVNCK